MDLSRYPPDLVELAQRIEEAHSLFVVVSEEIGIAMPEKLGVMAALIGKANLTFDRCWEARQEGTGRDHPRA